MLWFAFVLNLVVISFGFGDFYMLSFSLADLHVCFISSFLEQSYSSSLM